MIGRIYVNDEGGGGAYFLEGGVLSHAPKLPDGRFDWEGATQVDPRAFYCGDPGWDFACWAKGALAARMKEAA